MKGVLSPTLLSLVGISRANTFAPEGVELKVTGTRLLAVFVATGTYAFVGDGEGVVCRVTTTVLVGGGIVVDGGWDTVWEGRSTVLV